MNVKTLHENIEWFYILSLPSFMENSFPAVCRLRQVEFKFKNFQTINKLKNEHLTI